MDQMDTIEGNCHGEPMHASCADLTVSSLSGVHWLPLEGKGGLVAEIRARFEAKDLTVART